MKIKNPKLPLKFSLLLSMNMEFDMQTGDGFNNKLYKKHNYCLGQELHNIFLVEILRFRLTHNLKKNNIDVDTVILK
jgi:hypothetical protein